MNIRAEGSESVRGKTRSKEEEQRRAGATCEPPRQQIVCNVLVM